MDLPKRSVFRLNLDQTIKQGKSLLTTDEKTELDRYFQQFQEAALSTDQDRLQQLLERELKPYLLSLSPSRSCPDQMILLYESLAFNALRGHGRYCALEDFLKNPNYRTFIAIDPATQGPSGVVYAFHNRTVYRMTADVDYVFKVPLPDNTFKLYARTHISTPQARPCDQNKTTLAQELFTEKGVIVLFRPKPAQGCIKHATQTIYSEAVVAYFETMFGDERVEEEVAEDSAAFPAEKVILP